MPGPRFSQILTSFQPSLPLAIASSSSPPLLRSLPDILDNLTHFSTPTLAHLIALLTHPTPTFPPPKTSLIIFDSFSTLINNAFPRNVDAIARPLKPGASKPPNRKFPILQYLINSFQKLAAMCNIAVVVLSQCVTKMRPAVSAVLVPAINNTAWEQGLGCRIALSRDWGWEDEDGRDVSDVRLADVVKAEGISLSGERRRLVGFTIAEVHLHRDKSSKELRFSTLTFCRQGYNLLPSQQSPHNSKAPSRGLKYHPTYQPKALPSHSPKSESCSTPTSRYPTARRKMMKTMDGRKKTKRICLQCLRSGKAAKTFWYRL